MVFPPERFYYTTLIRLPTTSYLSLQPGSNLQVILYESKHKKGRETPGPFHYFYFVMPP